MGLEETLHHEDPPLPGVLAYSGIHVQHRSGGDTDVAAASFVSPLQEKNDYKPKSSVGAMPSTEHSMRATFKLGSARPET